MRTKPVTLKQVRKLFIAGGRRGWWHYNPPQKSCSACLGLKVTLVARAAAFAASPRAALKLGKCSPSWHFCCDKRCFLSQAHLPLPHQDALNCNHPFPSMDLLQVRSFSFFPYFVFFLLQRCTWEKVFPLTLLVSLAWHAALSYLIVQVDRHNHYDFTCHRHHH